MPLDPASLEAALLARAADPRAMRAGLVVHAGRPAIVFHAVGDHPRVEIPIRGRGVARRRAPPKLARRRAEAGPAA